MLKIYEKEILSFLRNAKGVDPNFSIVSIARRTHMTWNTARKYLHLLKKKGLVDVNRKGLWQIK